MGAGPTTVASGSPPALDERAAFASMFDAEFSYVCRVLRRLGVRPGDIEDQAQEVFVAVYRKFSSYDPRRPIRPWLCAFAYRTASNYLRSARHRREVPDGERPEAAVRRTPEDSLADRRAQETLIEALQGVPLERRTVLIMHDIDGFSAPEIADALSIPVNTVYSRTRIARDELKKALARIRLRSRHPAAVEHRKGEP